MKMPRFGLPDIAFTRAVETNLRPLLKLVTAIMLVIAVFTVGFHLLMLYEGHHHSWFTGFYWTLTVMSTLGFGDITFHTDLGRAFSIVVLLTGIVLLLIVLPFSFIRFFYTPFLEARLRSREPRQVPPGTSGHVLICAFDDIAPLLVEQLAQEQVPCFILEPEPAKAYESWLEGFPMVTGRLESVNTYRALRADHARLVLANRSDTVNTNITLTIREIAPDVPILALAQREESVDVLELSGATQVLMLKRRLGEQLALRVTSGRIETHEIGRFHGLLISELAVHGTPLVNQKDCARRLAELTGIQVIGKWERGRLHAIKPDAVLDEHDVIMLIGTAGQIHALDELFTDIDARHAPAIVIGAGRVGEAAVKILHARSVPVHLIDVNGLYCDQLRPYVDKTFVGDAADLTLIEKAGVRDAPSVLLTTSDDAVNIYLASYCRRLNPNLRIVSRINNEANLESIHRAGADMVLSYAWLGTQAVLARLREQKLILLGEGLDLFSVAPPPSFAGRTLGELDIPGRTDLTLIAVTNGDTVQTDPSPDEPVDPSARLILLGNAEQRRRFNEIYPKS